MKKFLSLLTGLFLVFVVVGSANAVPFRVSGSSMSVAWDWGGGLVSYTDNSQTSAVELGEGDSYDFTFGSFYIPLALGGGVATMTVTFASPDLDGIVRDDGDFFVWSFWIFSGGVLEFGDPEQFGYSYGGVTGGILELDFDDICGVQLGSTINLIGTITNVQNPLPVPEPATMLLFGIGLLGLANVSKKKLNK